MALKDNPRITKKEQGLLKGAIRRVFSRSELRRQALAKHRVIDYSDTNRPRVKKWSVCAICDKFEPEYLMEVDHINPVIPIDSTFADQSLDNIANNTWCDLTNLQAVCKDCHKSKTSQERRQRRESRK